MDIIVWTEPSKKFRHLSRGWAEFFTVGVIDDNGKTTIFDKKSTLTKEETFNECCIKSFKNIAEEIIKYPGSRIYVDTPSTWCALACAIEGIGTNIEIDSVYVLNAFNHNMIFKRSVASNIESRRKRLLKMVDCYRRHLFTPAHEMYIDDNTDDTIQDYTSMHVDEDPIITFTHNNLDTELKPDAKYYTVKGLDLRMDDPTIGRKDKGSTKVDNEDAEVNDDTEVNDENTEVNKEDSLDADDATANNDDTTNGIADDNNDDATDTVNTEDAAESASETCNEQSINADIQEQADSSNNEVTDETDSLASVGGSNAKKSIISKRAMSIVELQIEKPEITDKNIYGKYLIATRTGATIHTTCCPQCNKIRDKNRIYFNASDMEELKKLGYIECYWCKSIISGTNDSENNTETDDNDTNTVNIKEVQPEVIEQKLESSTSIDSTEKEELLNNNQDIKTVEQEISEDIPTSEDIDSIDDTLPGLSDYLALEDDEQSDEDVTIKEDVKVSKIEDTKSNNGVLALQIIQLCNKFNLYCSIDGDIAKIITTAGGWKFNFRERPITLYHQNARTAHGGFKNSEYHIQGNDFYSPLDVVGYIIKHDNNKVMQAISLIREKYSMF